MDTLNGIDCFVRSAEVGSFAEAARHMGLTPAAVGKNVAKLEASVGVRLFQRSTRSLTLTEAGTRFLAEATSGLSILQSAMTNLRSVDGRPSGTLKVSMGTIFGRDYVMPLLGSFLERYPAIVPDWHFENRPVDLVREGFDAAIGGGFDLPPGVVARVLGPAHRVLLASPQFLRNHRKPRTPGDLAALPGILVRSPQTGRVNPLPLRNRAGDQVPLGLEARMTMSDPDACCRAATMHLGVALASMPQALSYLEQKQLVRVLPDWFVDAGKLSIYYAAQAFLPAKTRVFVDFVAEGFRQQRLRARLDARAR